MKKRLLSLLVALCMAVTLLPVSALTAWAEESGSNLKPLQFRQGYPVLDGITPTPSPDGHIYTGDGWSYDATAKVLTLAPENPTTYDLKAACLTQNSIACSIIIKENATITDGSFINNITNSGTITGGVFQPLRGQSLTFANSGIITGGKFLSALGPLYFTNSISGTIVGGIFSVSSLSNSGTINGGIFQEKPNDGKVAAGYTLNVESPDSTTNASIEYFKASPYIIPHSSYTASITVLYYNHLGLQPFPIDVAFNNTQMLLEDWAQTVEYPKKVWDTFSVTFTAPHADAATVTLSKLTRLVIDENGYPVGTEGGTQNYSGNGWKFEASNKTLTLTSGSYDFSGEKNALRPLNPNVHLVVVKPGATLTGGAFKNEPTVKGAGTDTTDTFKKVTLNGTGSITAVNGLASGDWGNELYAVKTGNNTITASKPILDINRILLENVYPDSSNKNTVCINIKSLNSVSAFNPEADIILNQASHGLSLIMDNDGTPVIVNAPFKPDGNLYNYCGNGWHYQALSGDPGTIYLESGNYNFLYTDPVNKKNGENLRSVNCGIVNEGSTIEDGVFNTLAANGLPYSTSSKTPTIKGGTFAAGLYYNNGEITGGAFNGKEGRIFTHETVLSGNYRSVTVNGGAIVKVMIRFLSSPVKLSMIWCRAPHGICIPTQAPSSP